MNRLAMLTGRYGVGLEEAEAGALWSEKDAVLITYGDMVSAADEKPLATLGKFLRDRLSGVVSTVHILPFFRILLTMVFR